MSSPNILLLMGDQHTASYLGCYGHRSVRTPTLDALAGEGAVLDAAYCPSPICAPSRAAMMTGRHVHTIEVWDNASPLRCDWPTFAHSFRAAGYRTILCGKMHFVGPDQHHGFEERWVDDIYPADFRWTRPHRGGAPVNPGQNIDRVFDAGPGWTCDMDYDEQVIARAEYGLRRELNRRDNDRPFLLCVSFTGPHHPYRAPEPYWNLYTDDDVDLPSIPEDYLDREHEYVKWLRHHGRFDRLVDDRTCRAARRAYLARVTMLDDYLGRVLDCMRALDLLEDTVVVYTSDHGDMLGEHGLWFKNAAYENSSRVPWLIAGAGIQPGRIGEAVSLLDLGPTLCGLAGVESEDAHSDGRDLSDLLRGERNEGAGEAICENYGEGIWRGWRMIRRGPHKLTYVPGCEPELYDLSSDPGEWTDLAGDPAWADVRRDLEQAVLREWDPDATDEKRWQSEERRQAILAAWGASTGPDWQAAASRPPHPLGYRPYAAEGQPSLGRTDGI